MSCSNYKVIQLCFNKETPKSNFNLVFKINPDNDYDFNMILTISNDIFVKEFDKILSTHNIISIIYNSSTNKYDFDIKINYTDWNKVYQNLTNAFATYDIGVYAPFEERTGWMKSKETLPNKNLHITDNTDCTVWFLHPDIVEVAKKLDIAKNSSYGWGIDIILCKYAMHINKHVVYDTSVKVSNPKGSGYDSRKAHSQINILNDT
jgi:hypothetical protein